MARPKGKKNADFDEKRVALATAAARALRDRDGFPSSLGALASATGVTVPTLKHYFGSHDGVVGAALEQAQRQGEVHLQRLAEPEQLPLSESMTWVAQAVLGGWQAGVGELFAGALSHGIAREQRGAAVVEHVLEPSLQALERRLAAHRRRGDLVASADLRVAALAFLSPLYLGLLHQTTLGGASCRPLDWEQFVPHHVQAWLRAWGTQND